MSIMRKKIIPGALNDWMPWISSSALKYFLVLIYCLVTYFMCPPVQCGTEWTKAKIVEGFLVASDAPEGSLTNVTGLEPSAMPAESRDSQAQRTNTPIYPEVSRHTVWTLQAAGFPAKSPRTYSDHREGAGVEDCLQSNAETEGLLSSKCGCHSAPEVFRPFSLGSLRWNKIFLRAV